MKPTALLVAPTTDLQQRLAGRLVHGDFIVVLADSFMSAKAHLTAGIDLLVSELRLGAFNGLHLALRAQHCGVAAVVVGSPDPVAEHEAEKFGAVYADTADVDAIFDIAARLTTSARAAVASLSVHVPPTAFEHSTLGSSSFAS